MIADIIVEKIIEDISDRHGLRQEWEQIDEGIQKEIRDTWKQIINDAMSDLGKCLKTETTVDRRDVCEEFKSIWVKADPEAKFKHCGICKHYLKAEKNNTTKGEEKS